MIILYQLLNMIVNKDICIHLYDDKNKFICTTKKGTDAIEKYQYNKVMNVEIISGYIIKVNLWIV